MRGVGQKAAMDETLMIFAPRVINGITVCVTMVSARTLRSTTRITSADDAEAPILPVVPHPALLTSSRTSAFCSASFSPR